MEGNRKKGPFWKGMAYGIGLTILLMAATGCGASYLLWPKTGTGAEGEKQKVEAKVQELEDYIDRYYLFDYEKENLENGIYKGLLAGLGDVYTTYYTPEEYASFMETTTGNYCGIGAVVSQDYNTGIISIVRPFEGSPAEEAGLLAGDILYKVAGEEVTGKDLSLVVADLKGEEGTTVDLTVVRGQDYLDMTVARRNIKIPTVEHELLDDGIGYIAISSFEQLTDEQFMEALEDLKSQGMEDLIIDLRDNGGGLVDVTCNILDELLPEGLIVYTEDKNGHRDAEHSDAEHYFSGRMMVLINENSASASEIFAGAIKDYGVGTLIGTQSFGKGIVQTVIPMDDGSAVKITVSRYYTPKGNNIHEVGIEPDILLEQGDDPEVDDQLEKAIEMLSD